MKEDMWTQGHMNHKMSQKLPIGIHVLVYWRTSSEDKLCVPIFLRGAFDAKEQHILNKGHRNGFSGCRLGSKLGCHLGRSFGCTLG